MCAISGILDPGGRPASRELIARMTGALAHRGPDGDGLMLRGNVAFGHRRLSIIDQQGGKQPMTNEDGQVWVTFNGEIYNYRELAADLKSRGHIFKSNSDTEVIVHAWEEWGVDCLNRFRGMFAFAIMDWRIGRLFLARDQFGIKPLYFVQTPEAVAFASEIQPLRMVPGFSGELDLTAMDQYLWLQYIPAPRSIFKQIQKLPPAHCMAVDVSGKISGPKEYWSVAFQPNQQRTESEWIEAVDAAVSDSVKVHLVSDVPFGAFLSGGVDSSLVVANMSRLLGRPVETFSIGFEEKEFDETHHAAFASKITGSNHHVEIIKADALGILPELVKHYGEPFGDSSAIPTYYVSQLARRHVPMVLSGDGADEMFGGYWSHGDWLTAWADKKGVTPELKDWLRFINYTATSQRMSLWRPEFRAHCPAPLEGFSLEWQRAGNFSLANKVQYLDLKTYLPFDILTKVDIASMMHGLEVRTPLVDLRVIELAATIPDRFNLKRGADGQWQRKQLLKQVAAKYFPSEFLHRPKMGFAIPIAKWFAPGGLLHGEVTDRLLGRDSRLPDYFEPAAIKQFLDQGAFGPVWLLTFLQEWLVQNSASAASDKSVPEIHSEVSPIALSPAVATPAIFNSNKVMQANTAKAVAPKLPRVLMIADVPNWIFERHARTLHALLGDEFDFTLGYQGKPFNEDDFDLVYPLEFNLVDAAKIRDPRKYVTGIRSHLSWQPLDFLEFTRSLAQKFQGVHVVSKRLQNIFEPFVPGIELMSHGVDTGFFTPKTRADQSGNKLRLGWAGNRLSGSKKGFAEIIEPLGKLPGVELVFCGYNDRNLSLEQMKEFYDSLDAYVCASDFEGNNNSLLEAAAMQRAIITTDNGAVPEYLKQGESALIVERELPHFIQAVMKLRDDPALRVRLGAAAREAVKTNYDWREMGARYRKFFRDALNRQAVRAAAPASAPQKAAPPSKPRVNGYSFCIITNGKRPQKLAEEIASIRALQIPVYEILVGGDVPAGLEGVTTVSLPEAAQGGRLGEMRNRLIENSRYDHLVIADDDLLFQPDFYRGLCEYGEDYEVLCVRFLNADGTRYWDWATAGGPRGHSLLGYDETDPHVYVTGGLCVMKASVPARVRWDEVRGFYQSEDVDFSRRLHEAGISIKFNRASTVVHTDARYTQVENRIMSLPQVGDTIIAKVAEGKMDEARALHQRLRSLDAAVAAAVEKKVYPALTKQNLSLPVRWRGPIFNPSGYASEAINYILPLAEQIQLGIFHQNNNYSEKFVNGLAPADRERLFALRDHYPRINGGIVIEHNPANGFGCVTDAVYHIGRTMFETDRIAPEWVTACNQMDEIWVPSQFNLETFAASGVERDKLRVVPESVDETEFDPARHTPLSLPGRAAFNFFSIFEWSRRKGWDALLSAYFQEFSASDDVCLYLRTYLFSKPDGDPTEAIQRLINEHLETLNLGAKALPRIHIMAEQVSQADLPRLYKAVDCLVAPSRGEGWGRPHHEAMLMGLPVIATNWSGNTEFMDRENSYLIDYELTDTTNLEPELRHYRGQRWAEPSVKSLREAMRRVQQNPAEGRAKGERARRHMLKHYSRPPVTELVVKRLQEIEQKLKTPVCPAVTARKPEISGGTKLKTKPLRVSWEGSFLDLGSLSHVNRELTQSLSSAFPFHLTRVGQNALPANLANDAQFKNLARRLEAASPRNTEVTVRHCWPPNWERPATGAWVMIQPWEFGVLPVEWVNELAAVDEIWAPSEYVRRVYLESGVHPAKVKIVPNGIDPKKFNPEVKPLTLATQKKFKFLFVGGTIHRKGPDVLLNAYLNSFTAADDVCLVIKDFGGNSVYQGQTLEKQIAAARLKPNAPEILYLTDELPPEAMPALYTACQCLVHPYRGEGFALPVLEAMACGLPVVVTGGGATDDFATDEFAYRLPALRTFIGDNVSGMRLKRNGWWLEPQMDALTERLRWIFANPGEARAKGVAASDHVRQHWTWERAAQIAAQRLEQVVADKQAGQSAVASRRSRQSAPIKLPAAAYLGQLREAHDLFTRKNFAAAWSATLAAIAVRPFHCEGYLLLAEIAKAAGDADAARSCAQHARDLAPDWKPAKKFLREELRGNNKHEWLVLPAPILEAKSNAAPKLSVCLITKNEEKFLGQCLTSVRGLADQIVVLDTGSTDRTKEIAKQHGADVFEAKWQKDFSAARNAALEHATGDWILFLDADEELLPEHRETIRQEMLATGVMGYRLPIIDRGREEEGCSYVPRLFRNAPGLFFVGRVHEQVFSSLLVRAGDWGLKIELGKSALLHHGYTREIVVSRDKVARNLQLLELAVEEMPNEPNLLMNLGLELERSGRLEEGLEHSLEAFHLLSLQPAGELSPELRESLLTQISSQLMTAGAFKQLVQFWQTPFAKMSQPTASHHFLAGLAHLELKQPAEAAEQFRQCLAKRHHPVLSPVKREILKSGPNHCLAMALTAMKDFKGADAAYRAALAEEPGSRIVRFDYAKFSFQQGRAVEALQLLHPLAMENPQDPMVWHFGGTIALSQPSFMDFALNWTAEAVRNLPEQTPLIVQRAEALLLNQEVEAALPLWTKSHSPKSPRQLAALTICEILAGDCRQHFSNADEPAVSQEFLKWYRQLLNFKAAAIVTRINERLPQLHGIVPTAARVLEQAVSQVGKPARVGN